MFTAIGLAVNSFAFLISLRKSSAVSNVADVIIPSPPASETAAANGARPILNNPPQIIGY